MQDKLKGKTFTAEQKYIGIQNMGATCYMNSIIQTLFMTPEFRTHIFSQKIDIEKVKSIEKSIPIQIQKLFSNLQIKKEKRINTQDLIKSFGWTSSEAFQQHDSQEFIRILFEAIDNTFRGKFINDLYQGSMLNYVKCQTCSNESLREEQFLDIQLTIQNDFENIKNESIEEAFINLMRPEMLINQNQYFCEQCQSKQNAQRGCRIAKIPQIFTIQLNRFTYDYMIDKRVKLNGLFKFPYILNMNPFSKGFSQIPEELIHSFENKKNKAQFEQQQLQQKKEEEENKKNSENLQTLTSQQTSQEGKKECTKTKPQNIKDFLKNKRLENKKEKSSKDEVEIELFTDDVKGEKYILEINEVITKPSESSITPPPPPPPPPMFLPNLMATNIPPPPQINIMDSTFSTNTNTNYGIPQAPPLLGVLSQQAAINEEEQKQKEEQLKDYLQYLNESYEQYIVECKQQINDYLQEGDNVYELFSICMHSGGAYGGHYYAFIKSFEDNYWYKFNDSSVTYMELEDVLKKSVGGIDSSNGYMLFYRKYDANKTYTFDKESIPQYLRNMIEEEEKQKAEANKVITLKYDIDMKEKQNLKAKIIEDQNYEMGIQGNANNKNNAYHANLQICFSNEHNMSLQDINQDLEIVILEDINYSLTIEGIQKLMCMKYNVDDYKKVLIFRKIIAEEQILGQMLNVQNNKSLKELGITTDEILFVEIQESQVVHQYKWVDKFEEISSTISIKFNIPTQEEELQTSFSQLIKIDSRKSEQFLKQIMCESLKQSHNFIKYIQKLSIPTIQFNLIAFFFN